MAKSLASHISSNGRSQFGAIKIGASAVVAKVGTSSSTPAISSDVSELKDMVKALLLDKKNQSPAPTPSTTPAQVKAVEPNCTQRVSQTDFESYVKANDAISRNMQSQGQSTQNQCQNIQNQYQNLQNQIVTLTDMVSKLVSANAASSSRSGTLPGLSLPELTPTCMTLKLADRLVSKPIGIAKDVLFKVGVFHFPAD
nr:reverse transcriptase domain-containing protein [Tanacetum cinerariifolium]